MQKHPLRLSYTSLCPDLMPINPFIGVNRGYFVEIFRFFNMTRNQAIEHLVAFIDAARAVHQTYIYLYLQDNQLLAQLMPTDNGALGSLFPVIKKVGCSQQIDGRVSTGEHEIPARAADSVRVAQALLADLEENLTGPLFV
ncbi:hypothetical protein [Aeromonas dhakensis]|uniref:hypothetical protein n=1 Tax=Aeromonas dhakensis TaxID=196024 RepID=UPI00191F9FC5|nr:hypothetical protein [Aeromonas dhakensis]MCJ2365535.1 hypothetical protein [Aeromonas dhakensis]